ncbi:hypothetical protein GLOTRDRAFT_129124 [Gloeophyllum trabeum ATCC 11539]|uniref:Cytochrome P450 n=1 Tax=Gloeophyllum trabeum (strain ATCC 11539 / FP-39264 / Madison 617) TaxID=670483 RepID=S7RSB0_GLOTA|nr:uncharacterized protein GLOTRDRAFT_129124 [Gloeophyllum trabeum ATCC 11539]EPQ55919.1 hypothetical protein GLOTRDRAFT_129124 [Gloeophyllum trabeum ATCC 11539]
MDTTSSALAQLLHLLAQRPDVQEKLRLELDAAYENGELAHGEVVGLPYLDANLQSDATAVPSSAFRGSHVRGSQQSSTGARQNPRGSNASIVNTDCRTGWDEDTQSVRPAGNAFLCQDNGSEPWQNLWGDDPED